MGLYGQLLKNVLLPAHSAVRGRTYSKRLSFLEQSQWWSEEELRVFQWTELSKLVRLAWESVPYYQKKYKAAGAELGDIRSFEDFARLPVLTRKEVNEHKDELCSRGFAGKLLPHATGGSSGVPTRFFITYDSYDWRCAAKDRAYSWSGWQIGSKSAYLWGAPVGKVSNLSRHKKRLHEFLDRQLILNTFTQSEESWEAVYHRIVRFKPAVVVGYVSSLDQFAEFLKSRNLCLPELKAVIAAAEPLFSATRERISQQFGAPVFNTYGSREFMSLAGECEHHCGLHIHVENILLETQRPASEGASEILVTDLHNYGMPFLRYAIGDIGSINSSKCACGRALPRLGSIEGRVLDALKTADGKIVPGEFFPHLLKELPEVEQFYVQQKSLDHLVISAVLARPCSERSRNLLQGEITRVFGPRMKWELQAVDDIPMLASGKRRVTAGIQ